MRHRAYPPDGRQYVRAGLQDSDTLEGSRAGCWPPHGFVSSLPGTFPQLWDAADAAASVATEADALPVLPQPQLLAPSFVAPSHPSQIGPVSDPRLDDSARQVRIAALQDAPFGHRAAFHGQGEQVSHRVRISANQPVLRAFQGKQLVCSHVVVLGHSTHLARPSHNGLGAPRGGAARAAASLKGPAPDAATFHPDPFGSPARCTAQV